MEEKKEETKTMESLKKEYETLCALLGEKVYQKELAEQEIKATLQKISQLHAQAQQVQPQKESA